LTALPGRGYLAISILPVRTVNVGKGWGIGNGALSEPLFPETSPGAPGLWAGEGVGGGAG
jgi:hypothetical protein